MKYLVRLVIICVILFSQSPFRESLAQTKSMRQIERRSKKENGLFNKSKSKKVLKAERKAERTKRKQEKAYNKAKKKDLEHRYDMQSDRTKEMMKESKKKSDELNKPKKRTPFFKRIFQRKPR